MKFIWFNLIFFTLAFANALTPVKVAFLEALAPRDTTSSERFQKEYEFAVQTGKDLVKSDLAKCGYELRDEKIFMMQATPFRHWKRQNKLVTMAHG